MARRNLAEVATGAIVLVIAAGFLAFAIAHTGRDRISGGYTLTARFDRIDGLNVGGDLRLAGVNVGSVIAADVDPKLFQAILTLKVRNDLRLPKDTSAEITSDGLLGGKYVALVPGGDEAELKPGDRITITQSSVSLEELLGKFIFSVSDMVKAVKPPETKSPETKSPEAKPPEAKP
jgi:phospholipid/cholesterol/gamma-HCH transport system substrate-binding protein